MKKLYRNPDQGHLGGVCHGIGHYFNTDPVIVRAIWIAAALTMPFGPVFAYLLIWAIAPKFKQKRSN